MARARIFAAVTVGFTMALVCAGATDDGLLCASGEVSLRQAKFEDAAAAFREALERNPENARAHWGLGRIEQLHFRASAARDHFARAFSLDPRDPSIILSYAEFVNDAGARATLLRNAAILAGETEPERAAEAVAQLQVLKRLEGRRPGRLASAYEPYRIALAAFRASGAEEDGLLVSVRINGGKPLRLVLDTGARGIAIGARAAKDLGLETISAASLGGFGEGAANPARLTVARSVALGSLEFAECLVEVSGQPLVSGADGVFGLELLEPFLIHLDVPGRVLELTPFEASDSNGADAVPAIGVRKLLLLRGQISGGREGLFLVDTGAAFSSVSRRLAPPSAAYGPKVALAGARGALGGAVRIGPVEFRVGTRALTDAAPLAMDLDSISAAEGIEIAGILGYPSLRQSALDIDLRAGTVRIAHP